MGYHQAVEVPDCFLYNVCQRGREDFPSGFHGERGRLQFALQNITTDPQQFQQQFMAVGKHADIQSAQERPSADSHGWIHPCNITRTQYANLFATGLPWEAWKNQNLWYAGQGTTVTGEDGGSEKSYVSYLGRITYTLKGRYNVIATGRVDGSSAYPKDNRYGFFPSLGLGWTMSEENFLKGRRWLGQAETQSELRSSRQR